MSESSQFIEQSKVFATNETHRKRLLKVVNSYNASVGQTKRTQFIDWEQSRHFAKTAKLSALANLPELLEEFERNFTAQGGKVLWARDTAEAQRHFLAILSRHPTKLVVKSKSMTTEEIELNDLLEHRGIKVVESDLGEFIQQLAGEKPYHIVTPAMHQSKVRISQIFNRKLGTPITDDAEEMALACRQELRRVYLNAGIGVTGANFILPDLGAISITENEGNARLSVSCPPVHVAIVGIEKVLPSSQYLDLFLPLLATSGTGQPITCYNSIIRGPRGIDEIDGPDNMYVILLDNGRTQIFKDARFRQSLSCIRCGACLNACPVYKTVGGFTYETTYQGPIGSVITPHLRGKSWAHLSQASSLCGACTDVCPVGIDLHHLLLENRHLSYSVHKKRDLWRYALKLWAFLSTSRTRVEVTRRIGRKGLAVARVLTGAKFLAKAPVPATKSFYQIWQESQRR